jgi:hypothetical protein
MKQLTIDQLDQQSGSSPRGLRLAMRHEVKDGEVIDDVRAGDLDRIMIIDPWHHSEFGRTRNAILVLGIYSMRGSDGTMMPKRIYFLDAWAKACSHEEWIDAAIGERTHEPGLAWKWQIHRLYADFNLEAPEGWHHFFKEKLEIRRTRFTQHQIKFERTEKGKNNNIAGMEVVFQSGNWWMPRYDDRGTVVVAHGERAEDFMEEYRTYPHGASIDLLDLAGHSPQTFGAESRASMRALLETQRRKYYETRRFIGQAGY